MKLAILSLTILSLTTFAQDKQATDSSSQPITTEEVIHHTIAFENKKVMHGLSFIYTGNIENFIKRLATDLGKAHIIHEDVYSRQMVFKNIENPGWSDKKLILNFHSISNLDKHSISITCLDKEGNDYLIPDTESEKKITAFLEAKLKGD